MLSNLNDPHRCFLSELRGYGPPRLNVLHTLQEWTHNLPIPLTPPLMLPSGGTAPLFPQLCKPPKSGNHVSHLHHTPINDESSSSCLPNTSQNSLLPTSLPHPRQCDQHLPRPAVIALQCMPHVAVRTVFPKLMHETQDPQHFLDSPICAGPACLLGLAQTTLPPYPCSSHGSFC